MKGYVLSLAAILAPAAQAQTSKPLPGPAPTAVTELLGTWQPCGNARIAASDTNPRGVESAKLVFRPDATLEWRPAEANGPERSEFGRFEALETGVRLLDETGRELGVLTTRGRD